MMRAFAGAVLCLLSMAVQATTTASLSRSQIALGEQVELLIATDQLRPPETSALAGQFRVRNAGTERSVRYSNGNLAVDLRYRLVLEPLRPGLQTIPALVVGGDRTQPLQLQVTGTAAGNGPAVGAAATPAPPAVSGQGQVFVQTRVDDPNPYVQQSVGVVVRLYYATQLLDGALEQDAPKGASLTKVGDDIQDSATINGRPYQVIERRFVLVPDRSGPLLLPAARFRGQGAGGLLDDMFGDGRAPLSATGQAQTLQVQTIPASAAQPWLPLHGLKIEVAGKPAAPVAGEAALVTLRMEADGAAAAQLPELTLQGGNGALVYPDQPDVQESSVDGRPRTKVTRRFSVVPAQAGQVTLTPAAIDWWNVQTDQSERTAAPPLTLTVTPGQGAFAQPGAQAAGATDVPDKPWYRRTQAWIALAAVFGLAWLGTLIWAMRRRRSMPPAAGAPAAEPAGSRPVPPKEALQQALDKGDPAAIAQALQRSSTPPSADLEVLRERLADPQQVVAVDLLQRALWGSDAPTPDLLETLRRAFANGPRWKAADAVGDKPILPPLYPER